MADIASANQIPVEMIPVATQNTGSGDTFVAGTAGLMTADEKTKLAGIATGATNLGAGTGVTITSNKINVNYKVSSEGPGSDTTHDIWFQTA